MWYRIDPAGLSFAENHRKSIGQMLSQHVPDLHQSSLDATN